MLRFLALIARTRPFDDARLNTYARPWQALLTDLFERARDPSHTRLLPDGDIRALLEATDLTLSTREITRELRQGSSVPSATSSQLSVVTSVRGYSCGSSTPS